jgi:hypothetical protein
MRGDHAGLLRIEAACARRVRSTTSMIEGDGGGHSLGYMVRYRERAVLWRGSFQSRFESILRGDGWANKGDGGARRAERAS